MVRFLYLLCISIFLKFSTSAQSDTTTFAYKGILKAFGTIAPGYMLSTKESYDYLSGALEYYPEKRVGIRGDVFWLAGAQQNNSYFSANNSIFFGGTYHFQSDRFDFYLGLEPGVNFTKIGTYLNAVNAQGNNPQVALSSSQNFQIVPVISPLSGATFYFSRFFNFFVEVRYLQATFYAYPDGRNIPLNEIRVSAGLGLHLNVFHP